MHRPPVRDLLGTTASAVAFAGPWTHLLADHSTAKLDPFIDKALVVMSLLGFICLVRKPALSAMRSVTGLALAIRSGKTLPEDSRTGEREIDR